MTPQIVLTSRWRLAIGAHSVWRLLSETGHWPQWWHAVRRVETIRQAPAGLVGDVLAVDWAVPWPLVWRERITISLADSPRCLQAHRQGPLGLHGLGAWILEPAPGGAVDVAYRREVVLPQRWTRPWAAALGPAVTWNHFAVMRSAANGMAQNLGCPLSQMREWSGHRRH